MPGTIVLLIELELKISNFDLTTMVNRPERRANPFTVRFYHTLLGTSGLIHAYRNAAKSCLENASIIQFVEQELLTLHFGYEQMNKVMHLLKEEGAAIVNQKFETDCRIQIKIPQSDIQKLTKKILLMNHVNFQYMITTFSFA